MNGKEREYLESLRDMLINETYSVAYENYKKEMIIDKGKEREIMKLSYYPHRIVQWAIMLQLEDMFIKNFISDTYASIKGRGIHLAANKLKKVLCADKYDTQYCLKIDIEKYYPSIDNNILFSKLKKKIKDKRLLSLLNIIIFSVDEKSQPIGSLWSQWAGNFYLSDLDHYIKEELKIKYYFRYCDDMVLLSHSKEILHEALYKISDFVEKNHKLVLKKNYQVFPVSSRGVDFLGYVFFEGKTRLRKKMIKKIIKTIKKIKNKKIMTYSDVCSINSYLGWLKHCDSKGFILKNFLELENKRYIDINGNIRKFKNNLINQLEVFNAKKQICANNEWYSDIHLRNSLAL